MLSGSATWHLTGPNGREDWISQANRFISVTIGTAHLTLDQNPLERDDLQLRQSRCRHPGPFPHAFSFCPECGTPLAAPDPLPPAEPWPPATGLPLWPSSSTPNAATPDPKSRREEPVPASADLCFVVAGNHLYAYDLQTGWLHVRNDIANRWEPRDRLPKTTLPRWSWSAATLSSPRQGFALPTDDGPLFVDTAIGAATPTLLPDPATTAIGGAAALADGIAIPTRTQSGVALAWLPPTATAWQPIPVTQNPVTQNPVTQNIPADTLFAAPASHAGDVFWLSRAGQLTATHSPAGTLEATWTPWPQGIVPLLGTRPLLGPSGSLYQLVQIDRERLAFRAINVAHASQHDVSSFWLSAGKAAFNGNRMRRLPWEETGIRGQYPHEEGEFLLPLLTIGERGFVLARCTGRMQLSAFLDTDHAQADQRRCDLYFTDKITDLAPKLDKQVKARSAWDIAPFVHRGRLYIYAANTNQCWSWALDDHPSA